MVRVGTVGPLAIPFPAPALIDRSGLPSAGLSPAGVPWPGDSFQLAGRAGQYLPGLPGSPLPNYQNPLTLLGVNGIPPFSIGGANFSIPSLQLGFDPRHLSFGLALPRTTYSGPLPGGAGTIAADHLGVSNPFTGQFSHGVQNLAVRGPGYGIDGAITAGGQLSPAFFPTLIRGLAQNPNDPLRALLDAGSTSRFAEENALSGFFDRGGHRVDWTHQGLLGVDGPDRRLYGRQNFGARGTTGGVSNLFGAGIDLPAASFATHGNFGFDVTPNRQTVAGANRLVATLDAPLMYGGREILPAGTRLDNHFAGFADRGPGGLALGLRNLLGIENRDLTGGVVDAGLSARITPGSQAGAIDARGAAAIGFGGRAARELDLGGIFPGVPLAVRQGAELRGGAELAFEARDLSRDGVRDYRLAGSAALSTGLVTTDDIRLGANGPVLIPRGTAIDPTIAARFAATPDQLTAFLRDRIGLRTAAIETPLGRLPGFEGTIGGEQRIDLTRDRFRGAGNLVIDGRIDDPLKLGPFELAPAGSRLLGELRGAVDVDTANGSGTARIDGADLFAGRRVESNWGYAQRGLELRGRGDFAWDRGGLSRAIGDVEAFSGVRAGTRSGGDHRGLFAEGNAGVRANAGVDYDGGKLRRAEGDLYATAGSRLGFETKHGRTSIGAEVKAGASLGFSAKAEKNDINLGAKAFIGASAGIEARHDIKKNGKDVGHVSAKAEALVGVGFDAKFQTTKKDGKLEWRFELGAALGLGFKIGFGGSINLPKEKQAAEKTRAAVERATRG